MYTPTVMGQIDKKTARGPQGMPNSYSRSIMLMIREGCTRRHLPDEENITPSCGQQRRRQSSGISPAE